MTRIWAVLQPTILLLTVAWSACSASAWEIQVQSKVVARSALVRLGDIVEISGLKTHARQDLERLVVVAAPTPSRSCSLTAAEIRRVMEQHGVELAQCRATGATRVTIFGSSRAMNKSTSAAVVERQPSASRDMRGLRQQVVQAVLRQVAPHNDPDDRPQVDVELARRSLWDVPEDWQALSVEGLRPLNGCPQEVKVRFVSGDQETWIPANVRIDRPTLAVVALKELVPGVIIGPADVELRTEMNSGRRSTVARLEDVVGHQVKRKIPVGRAVDSAAVQAPLLVHRREQVKVLARAGSVSVWRNAVALQDGALGDVIQLQAENDRQRRFSAQVTGRKTAAVFVGPVVVDSKGFAQGR